MMFILYEKVISNNVYNFTLNRTIWIVGIAAAFLAVTLTATTWVEASEFLIVADLRPVNLAVVFETTTELTNAESPTVPSDTQMVAIIRTTETVTDVKAAIVASLNDQGYGPRAGGDVENSMIGDFEVLGLQSTFPLPLVSGLGPVPGR